MSAPSRIPWTVLALTCAACAAASGCRDLSQFSTGSGSFQGNIVAASFVLSGLPPTLGPGPQGPDGGTAAGPPRSMCITLDTNHLQDTTPPPGSISTNDGIFHAARMRTIPPIFADPLSTLGFGEGRLKNLVYAVDASSPVDGGASNAIVVVSLLQSGDVEVRLLQGTVLVPSDAGGGDSLFALFQLKRQSTPCSF